MILIQISFQVRQQLMTGKLLQLQITQKTLFRNLQDISKCIKVIIVDSTINDITKNSSTHWKREFNNYLIKLNTSHDNYEQCCLTGK